MRQLLTLPGGFAEEDIGGTWQQAVGLTFAANGDLYVWEKAGRVWRVHPEGEKELFLDIRSQVATFGDHGLLGFALHPNFLSNGYFYLLYAADHYDLTHAGLPDYDSNASEDVDTIGRLVRYQARAEDGFETVNLDSRKILIGETLQAGCPLIHQSHGVGSLVFASDGTLLVSCGDGASYGLADHGGFIGGSSNTALGEGIIRAAEDVGAFRSQLVNSMAGKILRIDPSTGDGLPSNPFFDDAAPRSPASRVWALGLRNPFRFTVRPGTGGHDPAEGNPGTVYVGDVGWNRFEELDVVTGPGQNFGWPLFEGLSAQDEYNAHNPLNLDAPNPLFGIGNCTVATVPFKSLIVQDSLHDASFPNPCDAAQPLPASIPTFKHKRPALQWSRTGASMVPTYDASGAATQTPSTQVVTGTSSTGGVWYEGDDFPSMYKDTYFHADYSEGWIKNFVFDAQDRLVEIRPFAPATVNTPIVGLASSPIDGGLYYIKYEQTVRRIRYVGSGNQKPLAVLEASTQYGPAPLSVTFDGTRSRDPELGPLTYAWDFGDGSPISTLPGPTHVFDTGTTAPRGYTVTLTVTDSGGLSASETLLIAVNDTPPQVQITSPVDGSPFDNDVTTTVALSASISDAEQPQSELTCLWKPILHHNQHNHPLADIVGCTGQSADLPPVPCGDEIYFYQIKLTVSDSIGLSSESSVSVYPDCAPRLLSPVDDTVGPAPSYVWQRVPGADQYQVRVRAPGATVAVDTTVTPDEVGCEEAPNPCSFTPTTNLPLGTASWEVRAHNGDLGWRDWSVPGHFTVANLGVGLNAEYFANQDLAGSPVLVRTDPTVDFDWGAESPDVSLPVDLFSVRWTGQITAPVSGIYTIGTQSDDGVRLWLDGELRIDDWETQATAQNTFEVSLVAGSTHSIKLEYFENGFGAVARLFWQPPGSGVPRTLETSALFLPGPAAPSAAAGADQVVESSTLVTLSAGGSTDANGDPLSYTWTQTAGPAVTLTTSSSNPVATFSAPVVASATPLTFEVVVSDGALSSTDSVVVTVQPPGPGGSGLQGEYFANRTLTGAPTLSRLDPTVDFNWENGPAAGLPADDFSVRWTGDVQATTTGLYTFATESDDGVRLWIDGQLLIDNWTDHAPTTNAGTISLLAGQRYSVKLEFYEAVGGARARFYWTPAGGLGQIIPKAQLFPPLNEPLPPIANAGADQSAFAASTVSLSGAGSTDPNPADTLSYTWTQVDGAAVTLSTSSANPVATFTAPAVSSATALTFQLVVSDGTFSSTDTIVVTIQPPGPAGLGLQGDYFANRTLTGTPVLSRIDQTVNFDWAGAPAAGLPADNFSVRWTGLVQATSGGTYTFATESDDGVRLWIDGQPLIDNWTDHAPATNTGTITLVAGQKYAVKLELYEAIGGARARLSWMPPGSASQIIPRAQLFPPSNEPLPPVADAGADQSVFSTNSVSLSGAGSTDPNASDTLSYTWTQIGGVAVSLSTSTDNPVATFTAPEVSSPTTLTFQLIVSDGAFSSIDSTLVTIQPPGPAGLGLQGDYYANKTLAGVPALTRIDPTVNFDWANSPGSGLPTDNFSVRWTGFVQATSSGTYTFATESDDGVRLWINGQQLVDNWTDHGPTTNTGTISLVASQQYAVRLEFYEATQGARARLSWTPPGSAAQIIPRAQLFPPINEPQPPVADAGADQSVFSANPVSLSGSGSTDPNASDTLSYTWTQIGGVAVSLSTSASNPVATFTAPTVASPTALTFELVVSDGAFSSTDTIIVTVQPPGPAGLGLQGDYYANKTLSGAAALSRVDPTVNFDWAGAPAAGLPTDNFSVRWTGFVQATTSGAYTFRTESDDGVRLWIDGQQLINDWADHAPTTNSGTITLVASEQYSVRLEYYESLQGARARLSWTPPGGVSQIIPQAQLFPPLNDPQPPVADAGVAQNVPSATAVSLDGAGSSDPNFSDTLSYSWTQIGGSAVTLTTNPESPVATFNAPTVASPTELTFQLVVSDGTFSSTDWTMVTVLPPGPAGLGLHGDYYDNKTLSGSPALSRVDSTVNFDWANSPGSGVPADNFSVRWTGFVQATNSGTYTFATESDDGVRLWVNGQQLVDNWTDHAPTTNSGTIALAAGQQYAVRLEFYEALLGARARLLWTPPGGTSQVIPQAQLFP